MAEEMDGLSAASVEGYQQGIEFMEKMLGVARPESVFGQPVTSGEYTVITASEAWAAMGFGFGGGQGGDETSGGSGSGGGGGGATSGRPVAVIEVGPEGVYVENVLDVTKIGLAFITMLGSLLVMMGRMRRGGR